MRLALTIATCAAVAVASLIVPTGPVRAATVKVSGTAADLQAALSDAQDGDVILIKAGVYRAADVDGFTLSGKSSITIRGLGKVRIDGEGTDTCLTVSNVNGLTIENVAFRNPSNDGMHVTGTRDLTVRRCVFDTCGDSGIEDRNTVNYIVDRCRFNACSWGLALGYASSAEGVQVLRSKFVNSTNYAIDLYSDGAMISGCKFTSSSTGGTAVRISQGFSGSTVRKCGMTGGAIGVSVRATGAILTGNVIRKPESYGIELRSAGGHTCDHNRITKSAGVGIYVDGTGSTISDNVISKSADVDLEAAGVTTDNTYERNRYKTDRFSGDK